MRDLPRILAVYAEIDALLERELAQSALPVQVEARQILNDQAYFLLIWGQFEIELNSRCREAVRSRRQSPDWQTRRAWDLYNPEDRRFSGLSFEDRARLVLDAQEGRGSPFAITLKHYGIRNEIAHGKLLTTRVDVGAFVQDCYLVQTALHRAT
jgi:hypothetical protein